MKLLHAANILGINYSTAKMIMLKYRNTGKITSFIHEEQYKDSEHVPSTENQHISSNLNNQVERFHPNSKENEQVFPSLWNPYWIKPYFFFVPCYLLNNNQITG